ncbi:hypothetical protein GPALN_005732 [Globodera pallida]|nr:hypothetical protein GPALN_005732 [Globodera pallida]
MFLPVFLFNILFVLIDGAPPSPEKSNSPKDYVVHSPCNDGVPDLPKIDANSSCKDGVPPEQIKAAIFKQFLTLFADPLPINEILAFDGLECVDQMKPFLKNCDVDKDGKICMYEFKCIVSALVDEVVDANDGQMHF